MDQQHLGGTGNDGWAREVVVEGLAVLPGGGRYEDHRPPAVVYHIAVDVDRRISAGAVRVDVVAAALGSLASQLVACHGERAAITRADLASLACLARLALCA